MAIILWLNLVIYLLRVSLGDMYNLIHVVKDFGRLLTTGELLRKRVMQLCEELNPSSKQVGEPLEGRPYEAGFKDFAYVWLPQMIQYGCCHHPLFVIFYVIVRIWESVIESYDRKIELSRYFHGVNLFAKWRVIERVSCFFLSGQQYTQDSSQEHF